MELNVNMNCMKGHCLEEDDNFSNISRISYGLHNSLNSTCNSDSECSGPISVRDMIQHYNNQFKKSESNETKYKNTFKINSAKKYHHPSQHLLAATRSSYCGLNNYGSCLNCKQFADQSEEDNHDQTTTYCSNCSACLCCQNRNRQNSTSATKVLSSTSSSFLLQQPNENNRKPNNFSIHNMNCSNCLRSSRTDCSNINAKDTRMPAVETYSNINDGAVVGVGAGAGSGAGAGTGADINVVATTTATIKPNVFNNFGAELKQDCSNCLLRKHSSQSVREKKQNSFLSNGNVGEEEGNVSQQPLVETSYQSKTTIAKTSSGVRIIIDIFFDQEQSANVSDIVGSRVETDIPQSRILAEFQQQTMAANTADVETVSTSYHGL